MRLAVSAVAAALVLIAMLGAVSMPANAATSCKIGASGQAGILVQGTCVQNTDSSEKHTNSSPPARTLNCGKASLGGAGRNPACGTPLECYDVKPGQGNVQTNAFATQYLINGRWTKPQTWCPADQQPAVTTAAIREQALRLLPHVGIGSAWTDTALVNAEVILWAATGAARTLPTVTIVGQQVALRIDQPQARWDFGDSTTDTTSTLGNPYDRVGHPCRTAQCPSYYYGHTYRRTGQMIITLALSWHVHYRIGNGDWTDLPGPALTGPQARHPITVKEARGILIPNPH